MLEPPSNDERGEEFITYPGLCRFGFKAMLRLALSSKKNTKRAGSRETELWHITKADTWCLTGISGPDSAPVVIKINALQVMYNKDTFKPPALPYCFGTKAKQKNVFLVQIQKIAGLLEGAITSMMVALASVRQWLQQVATELGKDLPMDIFLAGEELDGPASMGLGHALRLLPSALNSFKRRGEKRQHQSCGVRRASW